MKLLILIVFKCGVFCCFKGEKGELGSDGEDGLMGKKVWLCVLYFFLGMNFDNCVIWFVLWVGGIFFFG